MNSSSHRGGGVPRTTVGIVQPFDSALDYEYWQYLPDGMSLLIARTPYVPGPLGADVMRRTSDESMIMPVVHNMVAALNPPAIAYSCTSGSFLRGVAGERRLRALMTQAGARQAVTTSGALLDALGLLGARRIALATPYDDEMTAALVAFLAEPGIESVSVVNLGLATDPALVDPSEVLSLGRRADHPEAEALFLSCTNLRTFDVLPKLEAELDKPVLAANQVTMWGALRAIGKLSPDIPQRLFQEVRN